jgi:hypothetical protein
MGESASVKMIVEERVLKKSIIKEGEAELTRLGCQSRTAG